MRDRMEWRLAIPEPMFRHALFGLLVAAVSLIVWRSLYALAIAAFNDAQYSHTLLVLAVSLSLIALKALSKAPGDSLNPRRGALQLAPEREVERGRGDRN